MHSFRKLSGIQAECHEGDPSTRLQRDFLDGSALLFRGWAPGAVMILGEQELLLCEKNKDSPYVVGLWEQKEQLQKRLEEESDETRLHCNQRKSNSSDLTLDHPSYSPVNRTKPEKEGNPISLCISLFISMDDFLLKNKRMDDPASQNPFQIEVKCKFSAAVKVPSSRSSKRHQRILLHSQK
ncbi:hypothetical protein MG293_012835 [Ovis ammon polii]|uniref:Uncharacterized protein n=1 Tax=Ovis ammon polii TaxID=230172 RepID=A0AAD4U1K1_OVIAM|nr:hypothetical protein MG293_012835 [Ovis ammon polii]